jgi:hypothetical protein
MAKNSVSDWSTTASDNTDIASISLAEGVMRPPAVNDAIRAVMAQIAATALKILGIKGDDIASATTTDLATATGDFVDITGTTTITGLGTVAAGKEMTVRFAGILTLTHNATSLILPGGANITTAAGDRAILRSLGSGNWVCIAYVPASGRSLVAPSNMAALDTADQVVTGGARVTPLEIGGGTVTTGTVTPDPGDRPMQYYTNGGAHTLAPGSNKGYYVLEITNNASAGAITTSGFTKVVGSFTTTNAHKFLCSVIVSQTYSLLSIQALQ